MTDTPKAGRGADKAALLAIACVGLCISIIAHALGATQKWDVGLGTTFIMFAAVVKQFPRDWRQQRFWMLVLSLLVFHSIGLWLVLNVLLRASTRIPTLLSGGIAFVEGIVLFGVIGSRQKGR